MRGAALPAVAALQAFCAGQAAQWAPSDYLLYRALVAEILDPSPPPGPSPPPDPLPSRDRKGTPPPQALAGFLVIRDTVPGQEAEILNLAVAPASRRQGIAAALLHHARDNSAAQLWLEVRVSNSAARAFYATQGFLETGLRPNYYQEPGEDAIVMCL
jgi:ribosomal protein S18 acetylase RimI-like enzyme